MKRIAQLPAKFLILLIRIYQVTLSPFIGRNCRYIYDIRIRRLGQYDPDITADPESIETIMEVKAWEEREEYGVRF